MIKKSGSGFFKENWFNLKRKQFWRSSRTVTSRFVSCSLTPVHSHEIRFERNNCGWTWERQDPEQWFDWSPNAYVFGIPVIGWVTMNPCINRPNSIANLQTKTTWTNGKRTAWTESVTSNQTSSSRNDCRILHSWEWTRIDWLASVRRAKRVASVAIRISDAFLIEQKQSIHSFCVCRSNLVKENIEAQ